MELGGKPYTLSLDLVRLAAAESHYRARGVPCNLLTSIPVMTKRAYAAMQVMACSLYAYHPGTNPISLIALGCLQEVVDTLEGAWPPTPPETKDANRNLTFDLEALAAASEEFSLLGDLLPLASLAEGLNLVSVMGAFPCALRRFRPDLAFAEARKLLTLESVFATAMGLSQALHHASVQSQDRFVLRIMGLRNWTEMAHA